MPYEDPNWILKSLEEYRERHAEESRALWEMTPAQRQAAMWRNELTMYQLYEWAKRAPKEVPLVNDEFAFISMTMADVEERQEHERGR